MKKVLFLLTTLALLMALTVTAYAATASASVASSGSVYKGEEITFTVSLSNATGIRGIAAVPDYDTNTFELVSGQWLKTGILTDFSVSTGDGVVAFDSATDVSGSVLKFTLKAKNTAAIGTYSVSCDVTVTDANGNSSVSVSPSSVRIVCNHSFTAQSTDAKYLKSEASCTAAATYFHSCTSCGEKGTTTFTSGSTTEHNYTKQDTASKYLESAATCTAKAIYHYSCTGCGAKGSETFEYGSVAPHSYTKKDTSATYLKSEANCTEAATYYFCCATCTAKNTEFYTSGSSLGHTGGTATCTEKAVCTRCSQLYGETLPHTYTQKVETDTYFKENETCTHGKLYYKSCTCGAKGTETFEVGSALAHSYTAKNTAAKYLKSAETCTTKAVYYYSCTGCGAKGTETFESDTVPSHSYKSEWSSDATNHYHECSKCGSKKDSAAHIPGAEPTETTHQTCTVCGYVLKPALGHTHTFGTEWEKDANDHWHACSCGEKSDSAAHTWDEGTVTLEPTTEEFGEKTFTCTVCGQTKVETLDVLEPETTEELTTDEITTEPNAPENDGTTEAPTDDEGSCGSMVGGSALLLMAMMLAPTGVVLKKRH